MFSLSFIALPFIAALSASAANFTIKVGDGGLVFNPPNITAAVGDTVAFQFIAKNHSVTQSTFAQPCVKRADPPGIDSGFFMVDASAATKPEWSFTIDNATAPLWFFCAQTSPANHCNMGMVFSINAPADKTFDDFKAAAMGGSSGAAGNTTTPETGSLPGQPAPTSSDPAQVSSSTTSAAPAASSSNAALPVKRGAGFLVTNVWYDDPGLEEMWVPYPLISLVTRLPQTLRGQSPLTFNCRTFETFTLAFDKDGDAGDVFDSVKELTVTKSVNQLYAFFYRPSDPPPTVNGWTIYSPRDEYGRMGIGSRTRAWRFTDINKDYSFSPTYPARLVVPTRISDTTLQYASKYRSKARIPALTYLHWSNYASITRASQPMVGITQNRSIQDEKLIEAIFQSHHSPNQRAVGGPVYGATTTNIIVDARPNVNAVANTAKGAGTENMDNYKEARKLYLGIDHIHTMRDSLAKVVEVLRATDGLFGDVATDSEQASGLATLDRQALRRSGWLRHLALLLEGTLIIVRNIHVNSSHVFIHCSDGWDRTSQLSALAQLCLDPYYRTIRGFQVLIEKDWVSFGHKFLDRCGHLSSDKFFVTPPPDMNSAGGAEAAQAFLASVQNRFASQTHVKETSPTFHQFLECIYQLQRQFPNRFEFNERFLRKLHYHLYSCQYGTFLFNTERERRCSSDSGPPPCEQSSSVWDFFNTAAEMELNKNPSYDPSLDDPSNRDPASSMGVLLPNPKDVRFWHELYGRSDEEMNGKLVPVTSTKATDSLNPDEGQEPSTRSVTPQPSLPAHSSPTSPSPGASSHARSTSPALPDPLTQSPSHRATPLDSTNLPPPSPSPSPRPAINKVPDLFSGSGVKSIWGKFSSNATAAFSVVQDAYQEATKDIKLSNPGDTQQHKTAELRSRDDLSSWREEPRASRSAIASFPSEAMNPWATSSSTSHEPYSDNPWTSGSVSTPNIYGSSGLLPEDPTIARPPVRVVSNVKLQPHKVAEVSKFTPPPTDSGSSTSPTPSATNSSQSDPLGVGFM
ncbi:hypothetical protein ONZ45_g360 [Pleurotus djamor]|nr:hypothetical protein ONZ45_g360 [Pleurotus djamor]